MINWKDGSIIQKSTVIPPSLMVLFTSYTGTQKSLQTCLTTVHCTKTTKKTCWREKIMLRCCAYMYFRILINLAASFRFPWETLGCDSTSAFWACDVPGRRVRIFLTETKQKFEKISTKNRMFYSRWLLWAGRREGGSLALGPRGDYNHGGGGQHHHQHHWRHQYYHRTMEEEVNIIIISIDVIIITNQPWRRRSTS